MVNIIGQNIKYKNGEIFSVLNQTDEQHVTLAERDSNPIKF